MTHWKLAIVGIAFALAAGACLPRGGGSPEAVVEGALRAQAALSVAPADFRSGLLPPVLATAWIAAEDAELARWFAGSALDSHRLGLRNVVNSHVTNAAPIEIAVDVTKVDIPKAQVDGDRATVTDATLDYVTHMAPGTWDQAEIPGVTMCIVDLRKINGQWFVVDESCNVSGG